MADDEYSFDTVTTAFRSNFAERKSRYLRTQEHHDGYGKECITVQIHTLSRNNIKKQVTVQVSTHQDALIISQSMSPSISCSDCTFTPIIEKPKSFD
eukprot:12403834-Ditylum_brightwellii.AAC.1